MESSITPDEWLGELVWGDWAYARAYGLGWYIARYPREDGIRVASPLGVLVKLAGASEVELRRPHNLNLIPSWFTGEDLSAFAKIECSGTVRATSFKPFINYIVDVICPRYDASLREQTPDPRRGAETAPEADVVRLGYDYTIDCLGESLRAYCDVASAVIVGHPDPEWRRDAFHKLVNQLKETIVHLGGELS